MLILVNKINPCGFGCRYGSYEMSNDPYLSSNRLSLIDRGFLFALAHVRGGGEMGRNWYENGKYLHKKNTFTDFIACAEHLVKEKYTSPAHLCIEVCKVPHSVPYGNVQVCTLHHLCSIICCVRILRSYVDTLHVRSASFCMCLSCHCNCCTFGLSSDPWHSCSTCYCTKAFHINVFLVNTTEPV